MTDEVRDRRIADAIESVAVPGYQPGFWERLDARLAAEGFPGLGTSSLDEDAPFVPSFDPPAPPTAAPAVLTLAALAGDPDPAGEELDREPVVAELAVAGPAARRRGIALLGAAAAVVLAVLALQLTDDSPTGPLETAAGGPRVTLRAPGGGSTTAGTADPLQAAGGQTDDGQPATPADPHTSGSTQGGTLGAGIAGTGAGPGATVATAAPLGPRGAKHTPQDAFVTWAAALHDGDLDAALALTGPRTLSYHEAAGTDPEDAAGAWAATYGAWADGKGGRIDALDAASSGGSPVVVLLLDRPAAGPSEARGRSTVAVVRSGEGWVVEPDARASGDAEVVELAGPPSVDRSGGGAVPRTHVIEVPAAKRGTYTLALDRATTARIPASAAVDGKIRWDPPDDVMTPGWHELVVVHVTDDTITVLTTGFEVA